MKHDSPAGRGILLILQAVPAAVSQPQAQAQTPTPSDMSALVAAIKARLDGVGLRQAVVTEVDADKLKVEAPGTAALDDLRAVLRSHTKMEIMEGSDSPPEDGATLLTSEDAANDPGTRVWSVELTDSDVDPLHVGLVRGTPLTPDVRIGFTPEGARKLAAFTAANLGKYVPVLLDGQLVSAPLIIEPLSRGEAAISPRQASQALALFVHLRYGPLPLQLKELEATVLPGVASRR